MKAPDWYADWRHEAVHQLMDKHARGQADFGLGTWDRYDYDLDAGTLIFSHQGAPRVVATVQVVGTTAIKANNWLWAWGNASWPPEMTTAVQAVRDFGDEHGIGELTHDYLENDDDDLNALGWELAAVTARVTDAQGAYRPTPNARGALFLVYYDMAFVA